MKLLVLFGYCNTSEGQIKGSTLKRVECAADVIQSAGITDVLTTGTFGGFNPSTTPHGVLLANALRSILTAKGFAVPRIHGPTQTRFTKQDICCVRLFLVKQAAPQEIELHFCTSKFHMKRVQAMAAAILPEFAITYHAASDGEDARTEAQESQRTEEFIEDWVNVTLPSPGVSFPNEVYKNAKVEQAHYDNLSNALCAGAIVVAAFPHTQACPARLVYFCSAIVGAVLTLIYWRFAGFAGLARCTTICLEQAWQLHGFSAIYEETSTLSTDWPLLRTKNLMCGLLGLLALINIFLTIRPS